MKMKNGIERESKKCILTIVKFYCYDEYGYKSFVRSNVRSADIVHPFLSGFIRLLRIFIPFQYLLKKTNVESTKSYNERAVLLTG